MRVRVRARVSGTASTTLCTLDSYGPVLLCNGVRQSLSTLGEGEGEGWIQQHENEAEDV